jgi:hypothetical protein
LISSCGSSSRYQHRLVCFRRTYKPPKRAPFDNEYILGILMQHKQHLLLATVTVLLCTASNLAAPVLSGMLFDHLIQQKPLQEYAQVRWQSEYVGPYTAIAGIFVLVIIPSSTRLCLRSSGSWRSACLAMLAQDRISLISKLHRFFSPVQPPSTHSSCPACRTPSHPSTPPPCPPDLLHPAGGLPPGAAADACVHGQHHSSW